MPYKNEFANPQGFIELAKNPLIAKRLKTYKYDSGKAKDTIQKGEILDASELKKNKHYVPYSDLEKIYAIDGSLTEIFGELGNFDLGAYKVGVVCQDLEKLRKVSRQRFVDVSDLEDVYSVESFTGLVPGRGILHKKAVKNGLNRLWSDKFRLEMYVNLSETTVPNPYGGTETMTLLDMIAETVKYAHQSESHLECLSCHKQVSETIEKMMTKKELHTECDNKSCGKAVYLSDRLFQDSILNMRLSVGHRSNVASVMSLIERLMMSIYIKLSSRENRRRTAYITDGSLALFEGDKTTRDGMLKHLQSYYSNDDVVPILFSVEKTGTTVNFAESAKMRETLKEQQFYMVTNQVIDDMYGKSNQRNNYFYGKKFVYKSISGKMYSIMVPPLVGDPYAVERGYIYQTDDFERYLTLGTISEIIDNSETDRFGSETAALAQIAEANSAASLPKRMSMVTLRELVEKHMDIG